MTFDEISQAPATRSENVAQGILLDLFSTDRGWVYYTPDIEPDTPKLINRYLAAHARVPGIITPTVSAAQYPMELVRLTIADPEPGGVVEAAVFLNGAVIKRRLYNKYDGEGNWVINGSGWGALFIAEEDAKFWNYPSTGEHIKSS